MGALVTCIEQKVKFAVFVYRMETNKILEALAPTMGNVNEICETISNSALELAATPLKEASDYPTIQNVVGVMLELKKAFQTIIPK